MGMVTAVDEAIQAARGPLSDRDAGVVELARGYAREIDSGGAQELTRLGPLLLAALGALLLTPAARAAALRSGKKPDEGGKSALDELREKRDARVRASG